MKSLTGRLLLSYLVLFAITFGGAGLLLQSMLTTSLAEADQAEVKIQLDGAARVVSLMALFSPDRKPEQIQEEIRKTYPPVRVVVGEPIEPNQTGMLHESGAIMLQYSLAVPRSRVYELPDRPLERAVQVEENGQVRLSLRVLWPDSALLRTEALRNIFFVAFTLALLTAGIMAFLFSRALSAPLNRVAVAAGQLAEGHWDVPLPKGGPEEVRELSEAFRTMAARLQSDFVRLKGDREHLQRLAAELAHELRTPIASLRTYHELLLDGEQENPPTRQELLERGAAQVARLEYLTHFLVDMARLESHAAPLNLQETDLTQVIRSAIATMEPMAAQSGVTLAAEAPGAPLVVLADRQRLGQALDNLLVNAIRWSPNGGTVTLSTSLQEGWAEIAVADEGPGIPTALMPRLFQPFVRGEGSGGLGLGLAIVRAVAQSHGGTAEGHNLPGGGARFILRIPQTGEA